MDGRDAVEGGLVDDADGFERFPPVGAILQQGRADEIGEDSQQHDKTNDGCHRPQDCSHGKSEFRQSDAGEKPSGNQANPPRREKSDFRNEDARRESEIRAVELREFHPGEILWRNCIGDLVVDHSETTRDQCAN